jgi:glycosyltransferase involved in cell wall biosynthesis
MKILLIHNEYQQDGGEKVAVAAQLNLLRKRKHEVYAYLRDNQEIAQYDGSQKLAFLRNTIDSPKTRREIEEVVRHFRPQVAHIHNVFPLISPAVYLQLHALHIPIVQTVHNYRLMCANACFYTQGHSCERCKLGRILPAVYLRCYRNSYVLSALYASAISLNRRRGAFAAIDRFIALTPFIGQKLIEASVAQPETISILGNFLPTPVPQPLAPDIEQPYIVFLGRLAEEKGINVLLEALRGTTIRAVILGDGPLSDQARQYAALHQLNVEFKGHVSGEEKYTLLGHALVSVVPSVWYEALPFSVIESAAVGTPVIASDIGSLGSLITEGENGMKFPVGNSSVLRSLLETCYAEREKAIEMGKQARAWFLSHFTEEHHYQSLLNLYGQLC